MALGRVAVFVLIMSSIVAGFAFYVGWRLIPAVWSVPARGAAWGALGLLVVIWPASFLLRFTRFHHGFGADLLSWAPATGDRRCPTPG